MEGQTLKDWADTLAKERELEKQRNLEKDGAIRDQALEAVSKHDWEAVLSLAGPSGRQNEDKINSVDSDKVFASMAQDRDGFEFMQANINRFTAIGQETLRSILGKGEEGMQFLFDHIDKIDSRFHTEFAIALANRDPISYAENMDRLSIDYAEKDRIDEHLRNSLWKPVIKWDKMSDDRLIQAKKYSQQYKTVGIDTTGLNQQLEIRHL